jgi:hypothetical protein
VSQQRDKFVKATAARVFLETASDKNHRLSTMSLITEQANCSLKYVSFKGEKKQFKINNKFEWDDALEPFAKYISAI